MIYWRVTVCKLKVGFLFSISFFFFFPEHRIIELNGRMVVCSIATLSVNDSRDIFLRPSAPSSWPCAVLNTEILLDLTTSVGQNILSWIMSQNPFKESDWAMKLLGHKHRKRLLRAHHFQVQQFSTRRRPKIEIAVHSVIQCIYSNIHIKTEWTAFRFRNI